jgi:hypothetical protein
MKDNRGPVRQQTSSQHIMACQRPGLEFYGEANIHACLVRQQMRYSVSVCIWPERGGLRESEYLCPSCTGPDVHLSSEASHLVQMWGLACCSSLARIQLFSLTCVSTGAPLGGANAYRVWASEYVGKHEACAGRQYKLLAAVVRLRQVGT